MVGVILQPIKMYEAIQKWWKKDQKKNRYGK